MNAFYSPILKKSQIKIRKMITEPFILLQVRTHLHIKDKYCLMLKGWEKIFQASAHKKQDGIAILIFNKMDFKARLIRRVTKLHSIIIKEKNSPRDELKF